MSDRPAPYPDWHEVVADLGDRVRAERRARGMSAQALAERAGLSLAQVKYTEAGGQSLHSYVAICWALGLSLDALASPGWSASERVAVTPRQAQILRAAADGGSLLTIASRLGTTRQVVGARLSELYRLFDVAHFPVGERRSALLRAARDRGLLDAA
ncbi:helix-turn-helix domain-containing protein [Streptomyces sp. NPDC055105]|uniref:helix-turn-helix domain-containing protein n=1 Tax=Streptomyces sp. NPDC055105 TaxID=3365719 RepID=UPI0037D81B8D